jgi:hypothetical protein
LTYFIPSFVHGGRAYSTAASELKQLVPTYLLC